MRHRAKEEPRIEADARFNRYGVAEATDRYVEGRAAVNQLPPSAPASEPRGEATGYLSVRLRQVTSRKGRSAAQEMDVPCENVSEFARSNVGSMRTTS